MKQKTVESVVAVFILSCGVSAFGLLILSIWAVIHFISKLW